MTKETESVALLDVHVKTKIPKKTKTGKDFWIIETNKGSIMCFDASLASKVNPSDTVAYDLAAEPPADGYKAHILKGITKMYDHEPVGPAAAPQGQAPAAQEYKAYRGPGAAMGRDPGTDLRISKLSVFAAIAQIQAAKIRMNPDMANASTMAIICETMDATKAVLAELLYPEPQTMVPPAQPAAPQPVSDEPPFKSAAQPAPQPAPTQPATNPMPPVTPKTAAPAPAPAPAATAAPVQTVDKAAQAQVLFGVKSSMDQAMADRVARMLAKTKA